MGEASWSSLGFGAARPESAGLMPTGPARGRRQSTLPKLPTIQPEVLGSARIAHHQIDRTHVEAEWRDRPALFRQLVPVTERQVGNLMAAGAHQPRPALGIGQRNPQFVHPPPACFVGDRHECAMVLAEARERPDAGSRSTRPLAFRACPHRDPASDAAAPCRNTAAPLLPPPGPHCCAGSPGRATPVCLRAAHGRPGRPT